MENSVNLKEVVSAGDSTQVLVWKTSASVVLGLTGLYYLMTGKRDRDLKCMLLGGVLILLAALVLAF